MYEKTVFVRIVSVCILNERAMMISWYTGRATSNEEQSQKKKKLPSLEKAGGFLFFSTYIYDDPPL